MLKFLKRFGRKAAPSPPPVTQQLRLLARDAGLMMIGAAILAKALGLNLRPNAPKPQPNAPDPHDPSSFDRLEPGRGRAARHPGQLTRAAWKDIAWRVYNGFGGDRLGATAAGVAFYVVLGVFPGISAFVSLYGLFFDPAGAEQQLSIFYGVLPHDALEILREQMTRIAGAPNQGLTLAFAVSLVLALWSANGAVKALFDALNVAYKETEKRNIVVMNLTTLGFTAGGIVFILTTVAAVVVAPIVLGFLGLRGVEPAALEGFSLLRWPVLFLFISLVLAVVYRFGPSRADARWRWILPGGVMAALTWMVSAALFSWYLTNFGNYQATYGSLGAFAGFMVWTWLSVLIVLLGAELNAAMEHQTAHDTTTGTPEPMGQRGALVADTVGPKQGSPAAVRYTLGGAQELSRKMLRRQTRTALAEGQTPPGLPPRPD